MNVTFRTGTQAVPARFRLALGTRIDRDQRNAASGEDSEVPESVGACSKLLQKTPERPGAATRRIRITIRSPKELVHGSGLQSACVARRIAENTLLL